MFRALTALGAVALSAAAASAQPNRLPLAPGVMPASPIGPGTQFIRPQFAPNAGFAPNVAGLQVIPVMAPYGYPVTPFYGAAFGGIGGLGYGIGYPVGGVNVFPTTVNVTQSVAAAGARPAVAAVVPTKEYAATLTLQFPRAAEVWLNGTKVDGDAAEERTLKSPVLTAGEQYTFAVKARWTSGGKTYEATRTVTLSGGDRSRLLILSGTEVG